jgi:PIN domain nuclease of toxin-antitoxin system
VAAQLMRRILVDHARERSARLKPAARRVIASSDQVYVSTVSAWEAALKRGLGRLKMEDPFAWMVSDSGFAELPLTVAHVEQFAALPRLHGDPFDLMLIAQARAEAVTLVTHDPQFEGYDVPIVWV